MLCAQVLRGVCGSVCGRVSRLPQHISRHRQVLFGYNAVPKRFKFKPTLQSPFEKRRPNLHREVASTASRVLSIGVLFGGLLMGYDYYKYNKLRQHPAVSDAVDFFQHSAIGNLVGGPLEVDYALAWKARVDDGAGEIAVRGIKVIGPDGSRARVSFSASRTARGSWRFNRMMVFVASTDKLYHLDSEGRLKREPILRKQFIEEQMKKQKERTKRKMEAKRQAREDKRNGIVTPVTVQETKRKDEDIFGFYDDDDDDEGFAFDRQQQQQQEHEGLQDFGHNNNNNNDDDDDHDNIYQDNRELQLMERSVQPQGDEEEDDDAVPYGSVAIALALFAYTNMLVYRQIKIISFIKKVRPIIQENKAFQHLFGHNVTAAGRYNWKARGGGKYVVTLSVKGPKGYGELHVNTRLQGGVWNVDKATLRMPDRKDTNVEMDPIE